MSKLSLLRSSIGRKYAMALSALFLLFFLLQHLAINLTSIIDANLFNSISHFMGTNPIVQAVLQPVLIIGVIFHFVMGFILEIKNRSSRKIGYAKNSGKGSSWMSRNMIWSGLAILAFMALHFVDFWFPELAIKLGDGDWSGMHNGEYRYHTELVHKFESPIRVGAYVIAFILLAMHLLHGFQSAFQSVGFNHNKYTPLIKKLGNIYAILIPAGFIFIALFHHINH